MKKTDQSPDPQLQSAIIDAVCEVFGHERGTFIESRSRCSQFTDARHVAAHFISVAGFSHRQTGKALNRSRATVYYSLRRYTALYDTDRAFRAKADAVARLVARRTAPPSPEPPSDPVLDPVPSLARAERLKAAAPPTPDTILADMRRRASEADRERELWIERKADSEKRLIRAELGEDAVFRATYIPFVIAEVVWDYLDTVFDLCMILRIHETKKLVRTARTLRAEYDRRRYEIINDEWRRIELENMEVFESEMKASFGDLHRRFAEAIAETYPGVTDDWRRLLSAVYGADTVLKALIRYARMQERIIARLIGHPIGSILPKEILALHTLIPAFADDKPLPDSVKAEQAAKVEELAQGMAEIELEDTDPRKIYKDED